MRRLPGALALLVVGVIVVPPTGCTVRSDEFLCEDAVAKLVSCCGSSAPAQIDCRYEEGCTYTTYPRIGETAARCIIGASCTDVVNGACGQGCP